jgi:hypothetical protein
MSDIVRVQAGAIADNEQSLQSGASS